MTEAEKYIEEHPEVLQAYGGLDWNRPTPNMLVGKSTNFVVLEAFGRWTIQWDGGTHTVTSEAECIAFIARRWW